jgi:hypothetical protein
LFFEAASKERALLSPSATDAICALIPLPRSLSSSCGYAAEVEAVEPAALATLMRELGIGWEAVYEEADIGYRILCSNDDV